MEKESSLMDLSDCRDQFGSGRFRRDDATSACLQPVRHEAIAFVRHQEQHLDPAGWLVNTAEDIWPVSPARQGTKQNYIRPDSGCACGRLAPVVDDLDIVTLLHHGAETLAKERWTAGY